MGGHLSVVSKPGEGSCFTLWLCQQPAESDATIDGGVPLPSGVPGLREVGTAVARHAADIVAAYVERLRADPPVPSAAELDRVQLENHTSTFLINLGRYLAALDAQTAEAALTQDAAEIQRVILEHHGAHRSRSGWTEEALEREYQVLWEVIERTVTSNAQQSAMTPAPPALASLRRFIEQAEFISRKGFRYALEGRMGRET